jgi:hypothetical protein
MRALPRRPKEDTDWRAPSGADTQSDAPCADPEPVVIDRITDTE